MKWALKWAAAIGSAALVVICVVGVMLGLKYQQFLDTPVLEEGEMELLVIPPGTPWPGVVERVEGTGLVDRGLFFDAWGRHTSLADEVRAGQFHLEGPMDLGELAELLKKGGRAEDVVLTLPEGLNIFEVADRIESAGLDSRQAALEVLQSPERFEVVPDESPSLEGYLYPETYRFSEDAGAEAVIGRLVQEWERRSDVLHAHPERLEEVYEALGLDVHGLVILASLIEKEATLTSEMAKISRVFHNRLHRGMQLQTDPTCVYGEDSYRERPSPQNCRDPLNAYSTYVIDGLPPGPIANPSERALEAALFPSDQPEHADYLYFVAKRDGTGGHHFTTNYRDHRQAIDRYLRR